MTPQERWLAALWPAVRRYLPPAPAFVVEIGCGRLGGFVPMLSETGYEALGIDPVAPDGSNYRQIEFEHSDLPRQLDGVIACTSLHHVTDPGEVLDKVAGALAPGGRIIVIEWDWEIFDEATARWCFGRLGDGDGWLHHRHDEWMGSGRTWGDYLRAWAHQHGLHSTRRILRDLERRFQRLSCSRGPYFFSELFETEEADELEAINAGRIQAVRVEYVGRRADHEEKLSTRVPL